MTYSDDSEWIDIEWLFYEHNKEGKKGRKDYDTREDEQIEEE